MLKRTRKRRVKPARVGPFARDKGPLFLKFRQQPPLFGGIVRIYPVTLRRTKRYRSYVQSTGVLKRVSPASHGTCRLPVSRFRSRGRPVRAGCADFGAARARQAGGGAETRRMGVEARDRGRGSCAGLRRPRPAAGDGVPQ